MNDPHERPSAYPLAWPARQKRTDDWRRTRASFGSGKGGEGGGKKPLTLFQARSRLEHELDLLKARLPVLSTNVALRQDGAPYSNRRQSNDPGAAVYFQLRGKPIVLACDNYNRVEDNIAALAAHIEAMRMIERHGVGTVEQMFAGFTALPAPLSVNDWREALDDPATLAEAEATYRAKAFESHPDKSTGSHVAMSRLNAAIDEARRAMK